MRISKFSLRLFHSAFLIRLRAFHMLLNRELERFVIKKRCEKEEG